MSALADARTRYRAARELQFDAKVALVSELRARFAEVQKLAYIDCTQDDLDELIELNNDINLLLG